ncbi:unnamed protein product [Adineta steineri]|uniref:Uncharacterized protein n=1 Tax=Adineta steineri TaxID=433720 RepID=A0A819QX56_9BILA|nr:unnamed protein product [Adineta steineri]
MALVAFACTVALSLIPLYVSSKDFSTTNIKKINDDITLMATLNSLKTFDASYLTSSGLGRKRAAQSVTNRQTAALNLAAAMGFIVDCIGVTGIGSTKATSGKGRRRRDIECDKTNSSGDAIVFGIALNYPSNFPCQNLSCQVDLFVNISNKFNTVTNVNITADDGSTLSVDLCHVQSYPDGVDSNKNNFHGFIIGEYAVSLGASLATQAHSTTMSFFILD